MKKACSLCGIEKDASQFTSSKRGKLKRHSRCNACKYEEHKKRRAANLVKVRAIERKSKLKLAYGISIEEYESMLRSQNGVCAICGNSPGKKSLNVDHCHATGKVRGLLCHMCNRGLGLFKDNTDRLFTAIKYLKGI